MEDGGKMTSFVAAFDIGSSYSGYAFSQRQDFKIDPLRIRTNAPWAGNKDLFTLKTPTVLLLEPDLSFHSFGYEAEDAYAELTLDEKHHDWRLFRDFKSVLYRPQIQDTVTVEDVSGRAAPAVDILAHCIRYLRDQVLTTLQKSGLGEKQNIEELIQWILPVPPTWSNTAKVLLKDAVSRSGCSRLLMPTETEVALLYCNQSRTDDGRSLLSLIGHDERFLMMDLGGGNMDVSVFKIISDRQVEQLYHSSKPNIAALALDAGFHTIVSEIVGEQVMGEFKSNNKVDYMELNRDFETRKRHRRREQSEKVTIQVPFSLSSLLQDRTGQTSEEAASASIYDSFVTWSKRDRLRVEVSLVEGIFREASNEIVIEIISTLAITDAFSAILLTGGLAESDIIQEGIQTGLHEAGYTVDIIAPPEASTAVMKGAVLYGHSTHLSQYIQASELEPESLQPIEIIVRQKPDSQSLASSSDEFQSEDEETALSEEPEQQVNTSRSVDSNDELSTSSVSELSRVSYVHVSPPPTYVEKKSKKSKTCTIL